MLERHNKTRTNRERWRIKMIEFNEYKEILEAKEVTIHNLLKFFKKAEMDYDEYGNIYINFKKETKNLPILVAHTDNVLGDDERLPVYSIDKKTIFCANGVGIGFDDKAGIIAIIELWKSMPKDSFRIIFTADEEVGGVGASAVNKEKIEDAQYMIELDRKGGKDIIQTSGTTRLCSENFAKKWLELGFKKATGTFTDLNEFKLKAPRVEMCNLSIGYYNPHQKSEYLNIKEFENTIEKVKKFITENKDEYFEDETIEEPKQEHKWSSYNKKCDCCNRCYGVEWREEADAYLCDGCYRWYNNEADEDDSNSIFKY
jgi:putative aminopeptidase FrvX